MFLFIRIADPKGEPLMVLIPGMFFAVLTIAYVTRWTLRLVPTSRQRAHDSD